MPRPAGLAGDSAPNVGVKGRGCNAPSPSRATARKRALADFGPAPRNDNGNQDRFQGLRVRISQAPFCSWQASPWSQASALLVT